MKLSSCSHASLLPRLVPASRFELASQAAMTRTVDLVLKPAPVEPLQPSESALKSEEIAETTLLSLSAQAERA